VVSLDDLMLRRVRLGLLLPEGARVHLPRIALMCSELLGWDENRWQQEQEAYLKVVRECYSLPQQENT